MLAAIDAAGTLTTDELAQRLDVSGETVRRDLLLLDRRGEIRRIHGGAMTISHRRSHEPSFAERATEGSDAKQRIGRCAAGLIADARTIVLDVGTTVLAVAQAMPPSFRGTVATCSLLVAAELAGRPGVEILVAGGRVREGDLALSNAQTVAFFSELRADVAFLGSGGVTASSGLTDFHIDEIATRQTMLAHSQRRYVLADASKLGHDAPHRVCSLDGVEAIITDRKPSRRVAGALADAGAHLVVAP